MTVQWTKNLAIGVEEVDDQHRELFKKVNDLFEACNLGKGKDQISKTIQFLEKYVLVHFYTEENIQKKYKYPGYPVHKAEHGQFIKNLNILKKQLDTEGPSVGFVLLMNRVLVNWLIEHVSKSDRAIGEYINSL